MPLKVWVDDTHRCAIVRVVADENSFLTVSWIRASVSTSILAVAVAWVNASVSV